MSRDSGVTYELVSQVCYELLGQGKRPTRPLVQAALSNQIGQKGSNQLVQEHIKRFLLTMGKTMGMTERTVDGVAGPFVSILDKALVEMVAVARQIAAQEMADREHELDRRAAQMEQTLQEAKEAANAADQLRMRAEGELTALQSLASQTKGRLDAAERRLLEADEHAATLSRTIDAKDGEIRQHFSAVEAANRALEQAGERHRAEVRHLMQQLDNERVAGRKEAQRLHTLADELRSEAQRAGREIGALREDNARLKAENAAAGATLQTQKKSLVELQDGAAAMAQTLQAAQHELLIMKIRYETAEQHRQETSHRAAALAEDLGRLQSEKGQLERTLADYQAAGKVSDGEQQR